MTTTLEGRGVVVEGGRVISAEPCVMAPPRVRVALPTRIP